LIAGKPTSTSHRRVKSTSTGALRIDRPQNPRFSEPLCRAWWIPDTPLRSEAPSIS
jgi:hypothetical protein